VYRRPRTSFHPAAIERIPGDPVNRVALRTAIPIPQVETRTPQSTVTRVLALITSNYEFYCLDINDALSSYELLMSLFALRLQIASDLHLETPTMRPSYATYELDV
jgi:hypothetical protein